MGQKAVASGTGAARCIIQSMALHSKFSSSHSNSTSPCPNPCSPFCTPQTADIAQILLREVYGRAIQGDGQLESPPSAPGQPPTTKSNGAQEPAEYEELFEEFLSPE